MLRNFFRKSFTAHNFSTLILVIIFELPHVCSIDIVKFESRTNSSIVLLILNILKSRQIRSEVISGRQKEDGRAISHVISFVISSYRQ